MTPRAPRVRSIRELTEVEKERARRESPYNKGRPVNVLFAPEGIWWVLAVNSENMSGAFQLSHRPTGNMYFKWVCDLEQTIDTLPKLNSFLSHNPEVAARARGLRY